MAEEPEEDMQSKAFDWANKKQLRELFKTPVLMEKVKEYFYQRRSLIDRIRHWRDDSYLTFKIDERTGGIIPMDRNGEVPSRDEYRELIVGLHQFYGMTSDAEIEKMNQSTIGWHLLLTADNPNDLMEEAFDNKKPGFVYVLESPYGYKIGRTKNLTNRLNAFGVKLPFKVEMIYSFPSPDMALAEGHLHDTFRTKLLDGEWYQLSEEDLAVIRNIGESGFF